MGVNVDEARRDDPARGIDLAARGNGIKRADGDDAIVLDRHIGENPVRASAVDDVAALDQNINVRDGLWHVLSRFLDYGSASQG